MSPGESQIVNLIFTNAIIPDLTANGVKLSGTIYHGKQPMFRYSMNAGDGFELLAVVNNVNKNIAVVQIDPVRSALLPNKAEDLVISYRLEISPTQVVNGKIKFDVLEPLP
jgi:hypothetical protein